MQVEDKCENLSKVIFGSSKLCNHRYTRIYKSLIQTVKLKIVHPLIHLKRSIEYVFLLGVNLLNSFLLNYLKKFNKKYASPINYFSF